MRIKDCPKITTLDPEQLILLDGNSGTKVIRVGDTPLALVQLNDANAAVRLSDEKGIDYILVSAQG